LVEDGEPDWLDADEDAHVAAACAEHRFEVEEIVG
jgi:hypothetical protein